MSKYGAERNAEDQFHTEVDRLHAKIDTLSTLLRASARRTIDYRGGQRAAEEEYSKRAREIERLRAQRDNAAHREEALRTDRNTARDLARHYRHLWYRTTLAENTVTPPQPTE